MPYVSTELQVEVTQFLNYEAGLLEEDRYHEWLDLLTDDITYQMPVRETVQGGKSDIVELKNEGFTFALFDDDKSSLELRVARLDTGMAYAETPPSITQRLITNVRVEETDEDDELDVLSNFLVLQVRHDRYESTFIGKRKDRLRKVDGEWKVARRKIELAQPILSRTISIFF